MTTPVEKHMANVAQLQNAKQRTTTFLRFLLHALTIQPSGNIPTVFSLPGIVSSVFAVCKHNRPEGIIFGLFLLQTSSTHRANQQVVAGFPATARQ
jgi:hypothetical protein